METVNAEDDETAKHGPGTGASAGNHHAEDVATELIQYVLDQLGARDSGMWL
jgi:hypothetical protein